MPDRFIPHEEQCPICGRITGCEDKYCRKPSSCLCGDPACQAVWDAGTIHLLANPDGRLPCCGKHKSETPRGDRMIADPTKVTCPSMAKPESPGTAAPAIG
jgi:hypothetical protein